jgi:hypothetical protein
MDEQWNWHSVCPRRVLRSIFAGAVTGGLVFALCYLIGNAVSLGPHFAVRHDLLTAAAIFVAAFVVWLIGLVAFAMAPWWIIHRIGFRNLLSAIILGFAMTFLVDLAIASHLAGLLAPSLPRGAHEFFRDGIGMLEVDYALTSYGWRIATEGAAELGLTGAIVAAVVWRTAYRANASPKREACTPA